MNDRVVVIEAITAGRVRSNTLSDRFYDVASKTNRSDTCACCVRCIIHTAFDSRTAVKGEAVITALDVDIK